MAGWHHRLDGCEFAQSWELISIHRGLAPHLGANSYHLHSQRLYNRNQKSQGACTLRPFSLVQFSHSVMSNSLRPRGLQHARPPFPLPTPGAYSNSCPSSQWCHPTISSSVVPFSSHVQFFPATESFAMSQFFTSGGQSSPHQVDFQLQHQYFQ